MLRTAVDAAHGLRREDPADEHLVRNETEGLPYSLERLVRGAVVDDDDLELRVVECEQRLDGRLDDDLLVVRGDDDAHRDGEARRLERREVVALRVVLADGVLEGTDDEERDRDEIDQQQVGEARQDDDGERGRHAARTSSSWTTAAARSSAARR